MTNFKIFYSLQFSTAIAKAWTLHGGELHEVDLFDSRNVPALAAGECLGDDCVYPPAAPALYIGNMQRLYYRSCW